MVLDALVEDRDLVWLGTAEEKTVAGGATIVVSGDRHLLALGSVEGIDNLTARQFLERLAEAGGGAA